jgi:hypothetical protein
MVESMRRSALVLLRGLGGAGLVGGLRFAFLIGKTPTALDDFVVLLAHAR